MRKLANGEAGNAMIVALMILAALSIGGAVMWRDSATRGVEAQVQDAKELGHQANVNALALARQLLSFQKGVRPLPSLYPDSYLANVPRLGVTGMTGTSGDRTWSLTGAPGHQVLTVTTPNPRKLSDLDLDKLFKTLQPPTLSQASSIVTKLSITGFQRDAVYPSLLNSMTVDVLSIVPDFFTAKHLSPIEVLEKAQIAIPPPDSPDCKLVPGETSVAYGQLVEVNMVAAGIVAAGWLHGDLVTPADLEKIPANSITNQAGVSLLTSPKRVRVAPNLLPIKFPYRMKIVGGVEGVRGPGSRYSCETTVKVDIVKTLLEVTKIASMFSDIPPTYTCMEGSTPIELADRSTKAIKDLKVGDKLRNPMSGESYAIKRMYTTPATKGLVAIDQGPYKVLLTQNHPVWTAEGPKQAGLLSPFDALLRGDGTFAIPASISRLKEGEVPVVWNLELDAPATDLEAHMITAGGMAVGDMLVQRDLELMRAYSGQTAQGEVRHDHAR